MTTDFQKKYDAIWDGFFHCRGGKLMETTHRPFSVTFLARLDTKGKRTMKTESVPHLGAAKGISRGQIRRLITFMTALECMKSDENRYSFSLLVRTRAHSQSWQGAFWKAPPGPADVQFGGGVFFGAIYHWNEIRLPVYLPEIFPSNTKDSMKQKQN